MYHVSVLAWLLLLLVLGASIYLVVSMGMLFNQWILPTFGYLTLLDAQNFSSIDSLWNTPTHNQINDLNTVINGNDVYGFIFNNSYAPAGNGYYGGYNYCNMPHVKKAKYVKPPKEYSLAYVEVIHRHHKRTPYVANTFPHESYNWDCSDEGLFYYGKPLNPSGNGSASTYWSVYTSPSNPFAPRGFNGTCQFPQITRGGLDDSWQHGRDLYDVYHDLLGFLPDEPGDRIVFRVTNNVITSQVAGMVVNAMYNPTTDVPLLIQPATIDSLEPTYPCAAGTATYNSYGVGSTKTNWTAHLTASQLLFNTLDDVSGVPRTDSGFHQSWDHYFDNLSSRLCHEKALPCNISDPTLCTTLTLASSVFRLGLYEYDYLYRSSPYSLRAATLSYGVYIAELAQNIRDSISSASPVTYRHNVAHDGSLARLLAILQVDEMVWPGLGAEVVFEIYKRNSQDKRKENGIFVRILWGGVVLRSSYPRLGNLDMLPADTLLAYFDELVGVGANKLPGMCAAPIDFESGMGLGASKGLDFCVDC